MVYKWPTSHPIDPSIRPLTVLCREQTACAGKELSLTDGASASSQVHVSLLRGKTIRARGQNGTAMRNHENGGAQV